MPPWCIDFLFGLVGSVAAALGRVVLRIQAGGTRPAHFAELRYWVFRGLFALVAGALAVAAAPVCEERRLIVAFATGAAALVAVDRMTRRPADDT